MHSQVKQEIKEVRYFMPVHQYLDFGLLNLVGLLNSFTALGILFKVLITGLSVNYWFWSLDFFFTIFVLTFDLCTLMIGNVKIRAGS